MPALACTLCRCLHDGLQTRQPHFCQELIIPDRERLRMFLGPCRDSGSHLSVGAHPISPGLSSSWALAIQISVGSVGLWRHRSVRRYFGSNVKEGAPSLCRAHGGKAPGTGRDPGATDAPATQLRGKELQKSRVRFPTTRITTLVLRS